MKDGICPKCQVKEVIPAVQVINPLYTSYALQDSVQPANLTVRLEGATERGLLTTTRPAVSTDLRAWICGACGYTELYAVNPIELLLAYKEGYR
jgi:hypothetical protein